MPKSKENIAISNLQTLKENPYPGDGIIVGRSDSGRLVQVLWLMGENEKTRNRKFTIRGGYLNTSVKVEPIYDLGDEDQPHLTYNALRRCERHHFVSNGETDSILKKYRDRRPRSYMDLPRATEGIVHMPDAPNYTPRIIGVTNEADRSVFFNNTAVLSVISKDPISGIDSMRSYYEFSSLVPGFGVCAHTYDDFANEEPYPSFSKDPFLVPLLGDTNEIAQSIWEVLNPKNRVAIVVKTFLRYEKDEFKVIDDRSYKSLPE
ncbi:MAG: IMP cyclohydrolase [Candidatus Daviesbacteria bacterium]|nr:IMP cyclohydrolase [Candidatus Daviesbacteria bacterium]